MPSTPSDPTGSGRSARPERGARRSGGRGARRELRETSGGRRAVEPGPSGGSYRPLSEHDVERIHQTALDVLENIGMAKSIPILLEYALARGCRVNDAGRLLFPRQLVEDVIAKAPRTAIYYGRDPRHDLELSGTRVFFDPGGECVMTLDFETGRYRSSTLLDLYDLTRLGDRLEHVDKFYKQVVATEIENSFEHDINAAYAEVAATTKHVEVGCMDAAHVDAMIAMFDMIAGGEGRFAARPFCSVGGCPVVSPLNYGADNSEICVAAVRMNAPVDVIICPQAGATGPAALAGTLVQTVAETLAGLMLVNLVAPEHPVVFGVWPFVSDLRTGSFSGGGGEQAVLAAAAAQIGNFYGLPISVGAGMSDSKLPDGQAGFEKGVTTTAAALAGSNIVSEAVGTQASLLGASFEAMVIDDEMVGMIKRVVRGIEVTDETLSYDVIREAVEGPGHFLGHPQTLSLMETEFHYPSLSDRTPPAEWQDGGARDMRERARTRVREILSTHYPTYINAKTDERIRERFPIRLPREAMRPDGGRW
jgi:trimethylamine--corrinoid protein Co-methyltransferase